MNPIIFQTLHLPTYNDSVPFDLVDGRFLLDYFAFSLKATLLLSEGTLENSIRGENLSGVDGELDWFLEKDLVLRTTSNFLISWIFTSLEAPCHTATLKPSV